MAKYSIYWPIPWKGQGKGKDGIQHSPSTSYLLMPPHDNPARDVSLPPRHRWGNKGSQRSRDLLVQGYTGSERPKRDVGPGLSLKPNFVLVPQLQQSSRAVAFRSLQTNPSSGVLSLQIIEGSTTHSQASLLSPFPSRIIYSPPHAV